MLGRLRGISEWAERSFVKERAGGLLAPGLASTAYRGQQGWAWLSVLVSGCLCEFPSELFSWQSRIGWMWSKGVDCRDPAGHRHVIPEGKTEAKERACGTLVMDCLGASVTTRWQIIDQIFVLSHTS